MYLFRKPCQAVIDQFITSQSQLELTYPLVGATQNAKHPAGFTVDHNRICLGKGEATFDVAKQALRTWQHYRFDWIELHRPAAHPEPGQTVGVLARAAGLWVLNACRIVYVIEEAEPLRRFAFAYGPLPEHAEAGEERFQVEWNRADDTVWYDIFAFSRPAQLLSKLANPYVRTKQKQFATESKRTMQAAVSSQLE